VEGEPLSAYTHCVTAREGCALHVDVQAGPTYYEILIFM